MARKGHIQPKHNAGKDRAYFDRLDVQRKRFIKEYLDPVDLRPAHDAQLEKDKPAKRKSPASDREK